MFHALVSLEKFMLNQAAVFLKFGPKRRFQSEYILLSGRGRTSQTALFLSFSVLASQRFQLPSSFEHFRFFIRKASEGAKVLYLLTL